jgi:pimeloyl-ACP methyl ester carboxylesterase
LTLAARFPEDVCAVGLLAPAGARVPPQRFSEMMRHLDVRTSWEGLAFTRRLFHRMPATALLFASQMAKVHSAPAVRAIRAEARVGDFLLPETLARVQMPTLLLWGASEKLLPGEMLAYFRRYLPPSARIEVVQGVGHVPQLERPREVVRRLTEFAEQAGVLTRTKPGARSVAQTPSAGTRAARPLGS